jgi:hypothetical protein
VHARAGARVAAVLREEDADVVPLGRAGDERRLHVHDRGVADERARVDHPAGPDLESGDGDVVGGAVVDPIREVVDAGLGEGGGDSGEDHGECYSDAHCAGP